MDLKLSEVMQMKALEGFTQLVQGNEVEDTIVTGITIMEAPDIATWMKEGNILLSSLYSLGDDKKIQKEIIQALAKQKIAALIVKSRNRKKIPQSLIDECLNCQLNLIEIPEETPYSVIMSGVMGELFNSQLNRANYFKQCHDNFIQISLNNLGVKAILEELDNMIQKKIIIYDSANKVMESNIEYIKKDDMVLFNEDAMKQIRGNLSYRYEEIRINEELLKGISIPVKVFKQTKCYIFIKYSQTTELGELEWIAIENATNTLNLEMVKQLAVGEIFQKFQNDLLDDLFVKNIVAEGIIYERAKLIGWNFKKKHIVVIYKINYAVKHLIDEFNDNNSFMKNIRELIEKIINTNMEVLVKEIAIRTKNDTIILLWPYNEKLSQEENIKSIKNISAKFQIEGKENFQLKSVEVGIGEVAKNIYEISRSYDEANDALKYGELIYGKDCIENFRNLGVYRLLCKYEDKEQLKEYVPKSLHDLLEYDKANKSNLLYTLEVFLNCDGNASKAAQELFVHYKTLLYRINKIKAIMNIDFLESECKLEIQIGLKILKLV